MTTVTLPWPPKELNPNQNPHWAVKARMTKKYRTLSWIHARRAGMSAATLMGAEEADVHLDFYPPDRHHRDRDNMVASMKAGLDGLADALKVDDNIFRITFDVSDDIGGMVKVTVTPRKSKA